MSTLTDQIDSLDSMISRGANIATIRSDLTSLREQAEALEMGSCVAPSEPSGTRAGEVRRCSAVDFSRTREQIAFRDSVRDFARQELNRGAEERYRAGRFPTKVWKKCAEFGIFLPHLAVKDGVVAARLDL